MVGLAGFGGLAGGLAQGLEMAQRLRQERVQQQIALAELAMRQQQWQQQQQQYQTQQAALGDLFKVFGDGQGTPSLLGPGAPPLTGQPGGGGPAGVQPLVPPAPAPSSPTPPGLAAPSSPDLAPGTAAMGPALPANPVGAQPVTPPSGMDFGSGLAAPSSPPPASSPQTAAAGGLTAGGGGSWAGGTPAHVDPRLSEVLQEAATSLPPGYQVRVTSGFRPGSRVAGGGGISEHARGLAEDVQIIDPQGRAIPNRGADVTGMYGRLARAAEGIARLKYPDLAGRLAWGGNFDTGRGSGVKDLMHFDLGGDRGRYGSLAAEYQRNPVAASAAVTRSLHQQLGGAPAAKAATPIANKVVNTTPPAALLQQPDPMALMRQVAQRIEAAAPDAPDNVKAMAWLQAMDLITKYTGPYVKAQLDAAKFTISTQLKEQEIQALQGYRGAELGLRERQLGATERLREEEMGLRRQQLDQTNQLRRSEMDLRRQQAADTAQYRRDQLQMRRDLYGVDQGGGPPGSIGGGGRRAAGAGGAPPSIPQTWPGMKDGQPPPGVREDLWDNALAYVQTGRMPSLGMAPGVRNQIVALVPAAQRALGIKPTEMAGGWASYAGERHGNIVAGGRAATLGMAAQEAKVLLPLALQASNAVDRSQYPSLNGLYESYLRGRGDESVVRLGMAVQALTNVYAQVMTRGGQSTDSARAAALHALDVAYNKGQFAAAADQMMKEIDAALQAPGAVRQDINRTFGPSPGSGGGGGAAPTQGYRYSATGPNGQKIYSNDQQNWFNADGSPYQGQ